MLPFLLPMAASAIGAGIGALANKNHKGKGALQGGLAGLGLGMGLKNAFPPTTILTQAATNTPSVNDPNFTNLSDALDGTGKPGLGSILRKSAPFANSAIPVLSGITGQQQQPQMLPPMLDPAMPIPTDSMNQSMGRPFAPKVQTSFGGYGGYYG